jgi:hypothetical protein
MSHLISNLPTWVIAVFFVLLWLGFRQTKTTQISKPRITLIPLVFLGLSLYGVLQVPHALPLALVAWGLGIRCAIVLGRSMDYGRGVVRHAENDSYVVPGSWVPLILMMNVFVIKFIQGYLIGTHTVDPNSIGFIAISSLVSGLISGTFLARTLQIFKTGNAATATTVPTTLPLLNSKGA